MTESVRKRRSKWDMMAEADIPTESRHESAQPAKAGDTCHDMSISDLNSTQSGSQFSNWPDMDADSTTIPKDVSESYPISKCSESEPNITEASKDCSEKSHLPKWSDLKVDNKDGPKRSPWDAIAGNETAEKDGNVESDGGRGKPLEQSHDMMKDGNHDLHSGWGKPLEQSHDIMKGGNHDLHSGRGTDPGWSHNKSTSPGLGARRLHSRSISPVKGRSRSHRSRSRSWSRSLSRSRSRSRSRGWSRSPSRSFRQESKEWDDKSRIRLGGSSAPCRDFAVGRCRRGSECRYLHEDGGRRDPGKGYDAGTTESRGNRYERSRSSGHDSKDSVIDSMEDRELGRHDDRGWKNYEVHRNNRSTMLCVDFTKGRCHRGSACKYVHHNASSDRGISGRGRGDLDASSGHHQRHEHRRVCDTPCKFFAEGRCRNGENCRFSHRGQVQSFAEGRAHDDKWVHSSSTQNRPSWDGPKWHDKAEASSDVFSSHKWSDGNSIEAGSHNTDREGSEHKFEKLQSQKPVDIKYQMPKEVLQIATAVQEHNTTQENSRSQQVSTLSTPLMIENAYVRQGSGFKGEILDLEDEGMVNNSSTLHEERNLYSKDVTPAPGQNLNQSSEAQYVAPKPPNTQIFTPIGQSQQMVPPAYYNRQSQPQIVYSLPVNGQNQFVTPQIPLNAQSFGQSQHLSAPPQFIGQSQMVPPPLPFSGPSQKQIIHSPLPSGQNQCIPPQPLSNVASFNPEAQSQQLFSQPPKPDLQTRPSKEESLSKAETVERKASPISSDKSTQRVVTNEQVAQLTNLSASLAQIFGNPQQLPQLYAALNPVNATGLVTSNTTSDPSLLSPHVPASSASFVQPNQGSWQYDSKPAHMEAVRADISNMPPGFASDPVKLKTTSTEASQTPLNTSVPLSVADIQKDGNLGKGVGLKEEEKLDLENQESKPVEMSGNNGSKDVNETATRQSKKEQLTAHSGDMDEEVRTDGESKRNKDSKGIRMFKFALVEHVKDMLKPTWKEGQLSKEAHKTIVKKVVDKVTGALQGPNIPQTQEKIDLYLSYSKPKLSKLVQAYVEKYGKI